MNTGDVRAAWLAAIAERKRAFEGKFRTGPPRGDSYEAEVPDTLDLDDLARTLYSCPHALLSYVIDYTTAAEAHASRAFAAGLLLCITIDGGEASLAKRPALGEHIAQLAALRRRCADRIAYGRFRHTLGLTAQLDDGMVAYAFDSVAGPAVTIAAGDAGGTARLGLDRSRFGNPTGCRSGMLYHLDGSAEPTDAADAITITLPANGAAVWYPAGTASSEHSV